MALALSIFGIAFAAFCVWLTVRIVNRRERWAKRTAVSLVVVLAAYPLSFGPAVWIVWRTQGRLPVWAMKAYFDFYTPIFLMKQNSEWVRAVMDFYLELLGIPGMTD